MKQFFYFLLLGAASGLLGACDEFDIAKDTPACVRTQTEEFARGAASCKTDQHTIGASVKEYRFQNQTVYVLDMGNCIADGSAEVIGENCQRLGFLGGFGGSTTVNGESFTKAEYKRTIWQN
ncbi:DUF6970 domain-containing protein [Hymenobacter endophyticus]|uniref:DUF6970 domain-containing protein n=1 Tax=Hymenobacter endophyticus TaxID=3076335 RepID=A0ABU3TIX2_9BACT|nr:hypothetical protein [Hymenobacter endophyticus]MDU0371318.1 hypothetical protein [Hymenobacter endophyticus]